MAVGLCRQIYMAALCSGVHGDVCFVWYGWFCSAMLSSSATLAVMRCLYVCVSVRHVLGLCQNE